MNTSISVVVLHYNNFELTTKYIENLKRLNWKDISHHFVIVDNYSPDKSGNKLKDYYLSDEDVTVIINDVNLGFAKGNNVGITYSVDVLNADLVVVSNNDISIDDLQFPEKLLYIYNDTKAAVIGPDIYSLSKQIHQSPIRKNPYSLCDLSDLTHHIDKKIKALKIIKIIHMYNLISKIKRILGKKPGAEGYEYDKSQENVVLQGAFFVLTRKYIEKYPKGLYEKTFLYLEEDILTYFCRREGLKTLYYPNLKVIHYDGYSTQKECKNRCDKYLFELQETRKSCGIMKELIMGDNEHER